MNIGKQIERLSFALGNGKDVTGEPIFLIGAGTTKSGTSWLYRHLRSHPQCHFRGMKELHYFSLKSAEEFSAARVGIDRQIAHATAELKTSSEHAKNEALHEKIGDLSAWAKVLAKGRLDVSLYKSYLLEGREDQHIVGEITPAYSLLGPNQLSKLLKLGDRVRIVLLLRDPVERIWSHIRMVAARKGEEFESAAQALLSSIKLGAPTNETRGILLRGDYQSIIERFERVIPRNSIHYMFYESLFTNDGIRQFWEFLGLDEGPARFEKIVFKGQDLDLSVKDRSMLRDFLEPQYRFAAGFFEELPAEWK